MAEELVQCWLASNPLSDESRNEGTGCLRWSFARPAEAGGEWQQITLTTRRFPAQPKDQILRKRVALPSDRCFQQLLATADDNPDASCGCFVVALIVIQLEKIYESALTQLNVEQQVLWKWFLWPADACF